MKWNLAAGLLTLLTVQLREAPPADACGLKLTIKSQAPRKAVARTSNPSDVLLLGAPPRRLESDLSAAGHRVDVAPTAAAAKKKNYAVVIADPDKQSEARSNFGDAVVLVRSGDMTADVRSVEDQVGRKPVRVDARRPVVASRPTRTPIAAGGGETRQLVSAKEPVAGRVEPTPVAPAPTPPAPAPAPKPPEKVSTQPKPAPPEVKPVEVTPTPAPEPKPRTVAKAAAAPSEVFFTTSSTRLGGTSTAALDRTVRWLKASPAVEVKVEGHADPTGSPEGNLELAQRRAELVRDYLVSAGIDASRIEVISYGDTRLKYGKTDPRNRRAAVVAK